MGCMQVLIFMAGWEKEKVRSSTVGSGAQQESQPKYGDGNDTCKLGNKICRKYIFFMFMFIFLFRILYFNLEFNS